MLVYQLSSQHPGVEICRYEEDPQAVRSAAVSRTLRRDAFMRSYRAPRDHESLAEWERSGAGNPGAEAAGVRTAERWGEGWDGEGKLKGGRDRSYTNSTHDMLAPAAEEVKKAGGEGEGRRVKETPRWLKSEGMEEVIKQTPRKEGDEDFRRGGKKRVESWGSFDDGGGGGGEGGDRPAGLGSERKNRIKNERRFEGGSEGRVLGGIGGVGELIKEAGGEGGEEEVGVRYPLAKQKFGKRVVGDKNDNLTCYGFAK
ncbi:hypothetical protein TrRE_jg12311 [Triparma retinervis]|uniref:Uncharacterized protein n=1 Tax=Triparma retinervis TaxID=2557542 RepID=A0A9W7DW33_9STRA|nr:hypothetical protein TrRE_jg12311 [Triparma retinervis]